MEAMPNEPRRVVITGVGAVSAAGNDPPAIWEALLAGRSALTALPDEALDRPHGGGEVYTGHYGSFVSGRLGG